MASLTDDEFFRRPAEHVNSVALIVKHMAGNLRSRWSAPLATDGEPSGRNRDAEFKLETHDTRTALLEAWTQAWTTLEATLASLIDEDLARRITIRGEPHTLSQALLRGATHAAYHTGQILYVTRLLNPHAPYLTASPGASRAIVGTYLAPVSGRGPGPESPLTFESKALRVSRVLETALYVDDVARSVRFYADVLALRLLGEAERVATFDAGSATILLLFRRGGSIAGVATDGGMIPPHDGAGPTHIAFAISVADLDAWRTRLGSLGVAIESEVSWPRGGRSLYLRDPDGHSVELATPGVWEVF